MATETHTTTFTRRAVARLLALAPMVTVPVVALASHVEPEPVLEPETLDQQIKRATDELSALLAQRWPDKKPLLKMHPDMPCPFVLAFV